MDWCTFYLDSKVQEFPNSEIKAEGLLPGPVLHISCSQNVKLLEAATIKIPLTVREDGRSLATKLSSGHLRVLHYSSVKGRPPEWIEITDTLETEAVVSDGIVTFQVKHFST